MSSKMIYLFLTPLLLIVCVCVQWYVLMIYGFSSGGGNVYNPSWRMFYDGITSDSFLYPNPPQVIYQPYSLVFTSYIDAVSNSTSATPFAETRRPPGTQYHLNQYQTNGWTLQSTYLSGTATVGGTPFRAY